MKNKEISQNTKKALAASLKKAMGKKAFSKITISEIIADCGINRNTFYYHFPDIYALLHWMFDEEAIKIVKQFELLVDYEEALRFVMAYVEENDYIISCAYDSIGHDAMRRFFYRDFIDITNSVIDSAIEKSGAQMEPDFKEFIARFYTEAFAGMLVNWVKTKPPRDNEKMIRYLSFVIQDALKHFE